MKRRKLSPIVNNSTRILPIAILYAWLSQETIQVEAWIHCSPITSSTRGCSSSRTILCSSPVQKQKQEKNPPPSHKGDGGKGGNNNGVISKESTSSDSSTGVDFNDWTAAASGSFGNLLLQMQKKEDKLHTLENVVDLDNEGQSPPSKSSKSDERKKQETPLKTENIEAMKWETARELDEAVKPLSLQEVADTSKFETLQLDSLYQFLLHTPVNIPSRTMPVLSQPDHYVKRIGRDMRMLALNIVAAIDSPDQWKLFATENTGVYPILESIRLGAKSLRKAQEVNQRKDTASSTTEFSWSMNPSEQEEALRAACTACRSIRDLCALSPEVAAVVTDGILRANTAWEGGLMADLYSMLQYANEYTEHPAQTRSLLDENFRTRRRNQRDVRLRCKLYVCQLLLAVALASDDAIEVIRSTDGLADAVLQCSSYAGKEKARRWLRYPGEMVKWLWRRGRKRRNSRRPFMEAANITNDLSGSVQRVANQILAALGYNQWTPKIPGQRGLRILALDGGGSRGMVSVTAVQRLMEKIGDGAEVADCFDIVGGTSTGGIIAFLVALRRETSAEAATRYNQLIKEIFVKSALSTPLMLFTTATYDESYFMSILSRILRDDTMLDSRADPAVPLVFCVTSKMSSTPTYIALFRNYNYAKGELPDSFTVDATKARDELGLPLDLEHPLIRSNSYERKRDWLKSSPGVKPSIDSSRHPGSFRVLQRFALRASTAAPTVFKPVMMGGEIYADGGIVSSNPTAVAIHEARTIFPGIPIELVVSIGTGAFVEQRSAPRIGWDGIIGQIVNSATDGEQIHHILEDILGDPSAMVGNKQASTMTRYFRFNPVIGLPDEFPIDVTDPEKLQRLREITIRYMDEGEQQEKIEEIARILRGQRWTKGVRSVFQRGPM